MAERGQRIQLRFGGVSTAITLLKTSGKPKAAQHETRRVLAEPVPVPPGIEAEHDATMGEDDLPPGETRYDQPGFVNGPPLTEPALQRAAREGGHPFDPDEPTVDPLGETTQLPPAVERMERIGPPTFEPHTITPPPFFDPQTFTPPPTTVQQGIHNAAGEWIDLTERLAEVDERTKLDGMHVAATIDATTVPRERVRDAHYIASADPETAKVLALLWRALRETRRAAVVKWTKRTAQALGVIVARGGRPHLVLLEIEWADNMRPVPPKASGPILRPLHDDEADAAVELVRAFDAGPSALDALRDERLAKRAELLDRARAGELDGYTPPPAPAEVTEAPDLAAALAQSADAVRSA